MAPDPNIATGIRHSCQYSNSRHPLPTKLTSPMPAGTPQWGKTTCRCSPSLISISAVFAASSRANPGSPLFTAEIVERIESVFSWLEANSSETGHPQPLLAPSKDRGQVRSRGVTYFLRLAGLEHRSPSRQDPPQPSLRERQWKRQCRFRSQRNSQTGLRHPPESV